MGEEALGRDPRSMEIRPVTLTRGGKDRGRPGRWFVKICVVKNRN